MTFDEERFDPHGECEHEIGRLQSENLKLRRALEAIEGGSFEGASNFAVAGDWRAMYKALQNLAREALK